MEMVDALREQWDAAVAEFRQKLADLSVAQSRLFDARPLAEKDPADFAEWQSLVNRITAIQSTVETIQGLIGTVSGWWGSFTGTFGLSGWRKKGIARVLAGKRGLAGLGALPVIPIGTLVAGVAAIGALVISIVRFVDYLEVKENNRYSVDLTQQGEDVRQQILDNGGSIDEANAEAAAVVNREATRRASQETGYNTFAEIRKIAFLVLGGILVIQLAPTLIDRLAPKGRR